MSAVDVPKAEIPAVLDHLIGEGPAASSQNKTVFVRVGHVVQQVAVIDATDGPQPRPVWFLDDQVQCELLPLHEPVELLQ